MRRAAVSLRDPSTIISTSFDAPSPSIAICVVKLSQT
jgi:hypothetical protein